MTLVQRKYVDRVNAITESVEPIRLCKGCKCELYYMDKVTKWFDDEFYCDDCVKELTEDMKVTLDDRFIEEPDWDSLIGGHDDE